MNFTKLTKLLGVAFLLIQSLQASPADVSVVATEAPHSVADDRKSEFGEVKCSVCQKNFVDGELLRTLPCGHQYHENCIVTETYLKLRYSCPLCGIRYDLDSSPHTIRHAVSTKPPYDTKAQQAIKEAIEQEEHEALKTLLLLNCDPNFSFSESNSNYWLTPLSYACIKNDAAAVELLLAGGANPNIPATKTYSQDQHPPLQLTTNLSITKLLLDHGADINQQDTEGWTALMRACFRHDVACVRLLLSHNARTDLKTTRGETAWHLLHKSIFGYGCLRYLDEKAVATAGELLIQSKSLANEGNPLSLIVGYLSGDYQSSEPARRPPLHLFFKFIKTLVQRGATITDNHLRLTKRTYPEIHAYLKIAQRNPSYEPK